MNQFFINLWKGEMSLAKIFWIAHMAVWVTAMLFFQFLSGILSMAMKPAVGTPLGLLFVVYNVLAMTCVIRSVRNRKSRRVLGNLAIFFSILLVILSFWVPIYYYGRPLFIIGSPGI